MIILLSIALPSIDLSGYVQSTITSKLIIFAFGCLLILLVYNLNLLFKDQQRAWFSKLDIFLIVLVSYISLNRYVVQNDYGFSIRYMELLGLGLLYMVLRFLSKKNFIWILLAIAISGILQAVYGNLQLLGYYPSNHSGFKLTGSYFNPGPYAGFLTAVFPVALGLYLFKEKIIEKISDGVVKNPNIKNKLLSLIFEYIPLTTVIAIILVLPSTHSRGAWLAVLIGSVLLVEYRYRSIRRLLIKLTKLKKTFLMVSAILVIGTSLFGIYHFKKGSADGRLFIWKVTTEMIKDAPAFGVGFDRFKAHYMDYQANYFVEHGETDEALVADNSYYTFNDWLQYVAENGLIGFLLLALILYKVFFIKSTDQNKYLLFIVKSTMLCIGAFALVSYPMQIVSIKLVLVVMLALLSNLDKEKYVVMPNIQEKQGLLRGFKIAIAVMVVTIIFKIYPKLTALDKGFKTWQVALTTYQYGDYSGAIEAYKEAYPILKKDGDFLMNYGKALAMDKKYEEAIKVLEQAKRHLNTTIIETAFGDAFKGAKDYQKAETAYQNAADMIPIRFYPLYLQAKLYAESGEHEKALVIAKTIINKEIKVPSTAIREIKAEMETIIKKYK